MFNLLNKALARIRTWTCPVCRYEKNHEARKTCFGCGVAKPKDVVLK